jgi:hypothetical protein
MRFWLKVLYWVVLTAAHLFVCYLLLKSDRQIAGILWLFFGFFIIFVMYYVYFPLDGEGASWPPYISACPDYLTMIAPNKCADFVGLNSYLLKKSNPALPPSPTDSSRIFDSSGTKSEKAARALQYGLTWSGLT